MFTVLAIALGVLSWSLAEYCIHRWAGHDARFRPNLFEVEHTRHHARGNYFAPSWKKGGAALVVLALVTPLASLLVGFQLGLAYALGFAGFYMTYEIVHRRAHTHPGIGTVRPLPPPPPLLAPLREPEGQSRRDLADLGLHLWDVRASGANPRATQTRDDLAGEPSNERSLRPVRRALRTSRPVEAQLAASPQAGVPRRIIDGPQRTLKTSPT